MMNIMVQITYNQRPDKSGNRHTPSRIWLMSVQYDRYPREHLEKLDEIIRSWRNENNKHFYVKSDFVDEVNWLLKAEIPQMIMKEKASD